MLKTFELDYEYLGYSKSTFARDLVVHLKNIGFKVAHTIDLLSLVIDKRNNHLGIIANYRFGGYSIVSADPIYGVTEVSFSPAMVGKIWHLDLYH